MEGDYAYDPKSGLQRPPSYIEHVEGYSTMPNTLAEPQPLHPYTPVMMPEPQNTNQVVVTQVASAPYPDSIPGTMQGQLTQPVPGTIQQEVVVTRTPPGEGGGWIGLTIVWAILGTFFLGIGGIFGFIALEAILDQEEGFLEVEVVFLMFLCCSAPFICMAANFFCSGGWGLGFGKRRPKKLVVQAILAVFGVCTWGVFVAEIIWCTLNGGYFAEYGYGFFYYANIVIASLFYILICSLGIVQSLIWGKDTEGVTTTTTTTTRNV